MNGPQEVYKRALEKGEIEADQAQETAIGHLQELFELCTRNKHDRKKVQSGFFSWFRQKLEPQAGLKNGSEPEEHPQGLYFWGGVGRGKTYLMDLFYETLPEKDKTRLHFHRFMRLVHQELKQLQGTENPLGVIARNFSSKTRVLCFDEFYVSDITDAMILGRLLEVLFEEGLILVATSNIHPDLLYENGLQRAKFLPAIDLIKTATKVVNVDGGVDYRLRALEAAELYHFPLDPEADKSLLDSFHSICPEHGKPDLTLMIEGRPIETRYCGDSVVWIDFSELCDGPRSQYDYVEIARLFQTVLISNVPFMQEEREDQARRFISLVDEFYDRSVKLIVSAEVAIDQLYAGSRLSFEFDRTRSRLQEMMTHDYLAKEHKP